MRLVRVIVAFLLPPYHVYQLEGIGAQLWINVALTILGWIPGAIHSGLIWARHGFTMQLNRAP